MRILFLLLCFFAMTNLNAASAAGEYPKSELMSDKVARLKIGDKVMAIMKKHSIPSGQVCVAKNGHILYSGAFGYANYDENIPVAHDNLFRIASISKVVTSVAIWQLIERGQLTLDDKAFEILSDLKPKDGAIPDSRLNSITISNLLEHSAGFGQTKGDPQFIYQRVAADVFEESRPASARAIVRMAMGDPLEFDPGTKSIYSNLGFNILGRVIEHVSGQSYESFVKENVLAPAGIIDMELGRTRVKEQFPKEVWYWQGLDQYDGWSVLDGDAFMVPHPYGADFAIEPFDAHGGWIASARDLVCLGSAVNGQPVGNDASSLVESKTLKKMLTPSQFLVSNQSYRAEGVVVDAATHSWSHTGGMGGTSAFLYSFRGEVVLACVFNRLPTPRPGEFYAQFDALLNTLGHCELTR